MVTCARRTLLSSPLAMSSSETVPVPLIESRIYLIRGQKVLLDADLAVLYEEKTRKGNPCTPSLLDQSNQDIASGDKCVNGGFRALVPIGKSLF